jgi:hypothetical protein
MSVQVSSTAGQVMRNAHLLESGHRAKADLRAIRPAIKGHQTTQTSLVAARAIGKHSCGDQR